MKAKILLTLIMLGIIIQAGFGKKLYSQDISIEVLEDGSAIVNEKYLIDLNQTEAQEFNNISKQNPSNLTAWQNFYSIIKPSVINPKDLMITATKIGGGQFGYEILLTYKVEKFAELKQEKGRYEYWVIKGDKTIFYDNNSKIFSLPIDSDLTIKIKGIKEEDLTNIIPNPWFKSGNIIRWTGGTSAKELKIEYVREKKISESFDLTASIKELLTDPLNLTVIIIIIGLLAVYRRQVKKIILESLSGEEEIEPPKRHV